MNSTRSTRQQKIVTHGINKLGKNIFKLYLDIYANGQENDTIIIKQASMQYPNYENVCIEKYPVSTDSIPVIL